MELQSPKGNPCPSIPPLQPSIISNPPCVLPISISLPRVERSPGTSPETAATISPSPSTPVSAILPTSPDDFEHVHRLAHRFTQRVRTELGLTACNSVARVTGVPHPNEAKILEALRRIYHAAASRKPNLLSVVEELSGMGVTGEDLEELREVGMRHALEMP